MKEVAKRILSALLVINILLVTGCSNQQQGQKESFDPATDYQYQYYQPDVDLGGHMGNITEDENGCIYYMAGCYVYKYDPKTKVNAPLCNKTNCLHDKETDKTKIKSCNAYYPFVSMDQVESIIAYENGYIYLAGIDRSSTDYSNRNQLCRIKADGSEHTLIHTFSEEYIYQIIHRGCYYYTEQYYDEDGNAAHLVKSYPLDGKGKEKTVFNPKRKGKLVYEINDYKAFGEYLYFCVSYTDRKTKSTSEYVYYYYDTQTGRCHEIKVNENEQIQRLMPFNGKIIYYTLKDGLIGNSRKEQEDLENGFTTVNCSLYEADLDGKNPRKIPIKVELGEELYSDGSHIVISNDNSLSMVDKKYRKKDPDKYKEAEYRVYDKKYKLTDTYTEGYKGYNGVLGDYPIYYAPLGVGDTSYFVKLDMDNGTAELYGGSKSKIGQLNGSQFKREKLATIKQSPAARYWIKSQNGVSRIW